MDIDKEQLKKAVNKLIDDGNWTRAVRLLDAVEMTDRNESIVREAIDNVSNVVSDARNSGG